MNTLYVEYKILSYIEFEVLDYSFYIIRVDSIYIKSLNRFSNRILMYLQNYFFSESYGGV